MQPLTTPAPTPLAQPAPQYGAPTAMPATIASPTPISGSAMQDILNRLPQVTNILVTVKASPSVDELAAALGLTIALNNIGKHATAVFSGKIPDAMSFLKPDKTFESDVHSLRDFIISLNKEKADKLRFAQEGEIVKIFITPKSNLSSEDLTYNAGDFNVEMVLAIGIANQTELDSVIAAHGKILHEATVATLTAGQTPSTIGSINWFEPSLTSASAMVMQLLQSINPPITISTDIATALLTGLVADTNMFSNQNTSPQIMELAAKLMSAGANHQLVASSIGIQPGAITTTTAATTATSTLEVQDKPDVKPDIQEDTPTPTTQTPLEATNTTPMAQSEPEPTPPPSQSPTEQPQTPANPLSLTQNQAPTPPLEATPSPSLNDILPKPVDVAQPVVPANLMPPPTQPILAAPPEPAPIATPQNIAPPAEQPLAAPLAAAPTDHPDQIRSEIDQIYSANSTPNAPLEPLTKDEDPPLPSSLLSNDTALRSPAPDTFVQVDQANSATTEAARTQLSQAPNPTTAIPTTKTEDISSTDLLGISDLPKLEVPSELPPPPPPPPLANNSSAFQPTVDFSQINQS